jgi:hypothetical protein
LNNSVFSHFLNISTDVAAQTKSDRLFQINGAEYENDLSADLSLYLGMFNTIREDVLVFLTGTFTDISENK